MLPMMSGDLSKIRKSSRSIKPSTKDRALHDFF